MLAEHGELYPYGATMSLSGEITDVGAHIEGDDKPASEALIDLITQRLQEQSRRGTLRAAGICYDVRIVPPGALGECDAVCCSLEHMNGEATNIFQPFARGRDGAIEYGEMFAFRREAKFFIPLRPQ